MPPDIASELNRNVVTLIGQMAANTERTANLSDQLKSFEKTAAERYVTKDEFRPVRNIVYGSVRVVLTAVAGGLLSLLIWHWK